MLCLIKIAEDHNNKVYNLQEAIDIIEYALDKKWLKPDMYVDQPCKILKYMTGKNWTYEHSDSPTGLYNIERWEWKTAKETLSHFRLNSWDSMDPSPVVKNGKRVSYRAIRKVD